MLDFTKNIKLEKKSYKKYTIARIILLLFFLAAVLFVSYKILFPSSFLVFSFKNTNSLKNTLVSPRTEQNNLPEKGLIPANEKLTFNANPVGNFSEVAVEFIFENSLKNLEGTNVNFRKSYRAFFYPEGDPVAFKNGALLYVTDGNYYIVSDGLLRKFANTNILSEMGYKKNSFMQISQEDLKYNKIGKDISSSNDYPDDALFIINDTYYQLKNGHLLPFVSSRAFLSQFDSLQAISKNEDFFVKYPVSETFLGFADGTLASFDQSAYILSNGKRYPIINAETFILMGFNWDDIIALDPEELGLYDRQKSFNRDQPHPDGTLFLDKKTNKYFVISDNKKHRIESPAIEKLYSKNKPVIADLAESEKVFSCNLKKKFLSYNKYYCVMPLDEIGNFVGNDYQIDVTFPIETKINTINTTFFTPLKWHNLMLSLSVIKTRLINNYVSTQK